MITFHPPLGMQDLMVVEVTTDIIRIPEPESIRFSGSAPYTIKDIMRTSGLRLSGLITVVSFSANRYPWLTIYILSKEIYFHVRCLRDDRTLDGCRVSCPFRQVSVNFKMNSRLGNRALANRNSKRPSQRVYGIAPQLSTVKYLRGIALNINL